MYAVADLPAEYVVDQPVLRDSAQPLERRCRDDGIEVMSVAGDRYGGTWNRGFDPLLQLFGGRRHGPQG